MKWYFRGILFVMIIFSFLFVVGFFHSSSLAEIEEEAFPIWEEDRIIGLNYKITIGKSIKDKRVTITTHVLDSIYHYKDVKTIDQFSVYFIIDNKAKYSYSLKDIYIVDTSTNIVIENIPYSRSNVDNRFYFLLTKKSFQKYNKKYCIQVVLER